MIEATRHYLARVLTADKIDALPVESWTMQEHVRAVRWALDGGPRPRFTTKRRARPARDLSRARATGDLDETLLAVIGDRPRPPR